MYQQVLTLLALLELYWILEGANEEDKVEDKELTGREMNKNLQDCNNNLNNNMNIHHSWNWDTECSRQSAILSNPTKCIKRRKMIRKLHLFER